MITKAGDPYGRDIPSAIPPQWDPDMPQLPSTPISERPRSIVSERDTSAMLDKILLSKTPVLQRILFNTWNANREDIKFEEIAKVFGTVPGDMWDPGGAFTQWQHRYTEVIDRDMSPQWFGAADKGDGLVMRGLNGMVDVSPEMAARQEFAFQSHMDRWVKHRGADFVQQINEVDRRAIRSIIRVNTTHPDGARLGSRNLGRLVRAAVGLTPRQSAMVHNRYLELLLEGVDPDRALKVANTIATRRRANRAYLIGRTEMAFAYNFGTQNSVVAAVDSGVLDGFRIRKVWYTQIDERVCPFCFPLHDQEVGLQETFPGATDLLPNTQVPPAHPACRCVILYEPTEVEVENAPPTITPGSPVLPGSPVPGNKGLTEDRAWEVIDTEFAGLKERMPWIGKTYQQQQSDFFATLPGTIDSLEADTQALMAWQNRQDDQTFEDIKAFRESLMKLSGKDDPEVIHSGIKSVPKKTKKLAEDAVNESMRLYDLALGGSKKANGPVDVAWAGKVRASMQSGYLPPKVNLDEMARHLDTLAEGPLQELWNATSGYAASNNPFLRKLKFHLAMEHNSTVPPDLLERWAKLDPSHPRLNPDGTWKTNDFAALWTDISARNPQIAIRLIEHFPDANDEAWSQAMPIISKHNDTHTNQVSFPAGVVGEPKPRQIMNTSKDDAKDPKRFKEVIFHELGHNIEGQNGRAADAARAFRERRIRQDGQGLQQLSKIFPGHGYKSNEKADPDKFIHAYVGKHYDAWQSTEVSSMALQHFVSPEQMLVLARKDPEMFAYAVALLKGSFGYRHPGLKGRDKPTDWEP